MPPRESQRRSRRVVYEEEEAMTDEPATEATLDPEATQAFAEGVRGPIVRPAIWATTTRARSGTV
jgi:hypothetical protein